jgi:WD40 repeat protein
LSIPTVRWNPGPQTFALAVAALAAAAILSLAISAPPMPVDRGITVVAVTETGGTIAAGTADGAVRVWDRATATAAQSLDLGGPLNDLRFSPSNGHLAVANRNLSLVDWRSGATPRTLRADQANYGVVRYHAEPGSILTINGKGEILLITVATGAGRRIHCCSSIWGDVEFVPGRPHVVWGGHWPAVGNLGLGGLAGTLTPVRQFMAFGPVVVSQDGERVFMGSQEGRVYVWDLPARRLLRRSPPQAGYVDTIAALGDSGWLAYAARGGPMHLWHTGTDEHQIIHPARPTSNLVFNPAMNWIAWGTASGTVELWDPRTMRRLDVLR